MPDAAIDDSRRLTGPSLLLDRPGAILEIACPADATDGLIAAWREEAARMLEAVGWDRCMVIGVSFGGMVGQELALRYPHRVERLVLACTRPRYAPTIEVRTIITIKVNSKTDPLLPQVTLVLCLNRRSLISFSV